MPAAPLELGFGAGQLYRQAADEEAVKSLAEVASTAVNMEATQTRSQLAKEAAGREQEMHPWQLREAKAKVEKLEDEAAAEKKLLQGMANLAKRDSTQPMSNSEYFYQLAEQAAAAGSLTKATEYRKLAGAADLQEARMLSAGARAQRDQINAAIRTNELAGSVLAEVKDEASFNAAQARFKELTGEDMVPPGTRYSPGLVDFVRNGALTRSQQLKVKHDEFMRGQAERRTRSQEAANASGNTYRRMNYELAKQREERLAKAGGKVIAAPTKEERGQVATTIDTEIPDMPKEDRKQAAQDIASDAKALQRTIPGLSWQEAVRRSIANAKKEGDIYTEQGYLGTSIGRQSRYQGGGRNMKTPLQLPMLHDGKPNTDKLRKGRFYTNAQGLVARWTGEGFEPVDTSDEGDDEGDD